MKIKDEVDFHGFTARGMREWLESTWSRRVWHGLQRVRIIHGKGDVLIPELRKWCQEKGIDWSPEPGNPGATLIYPGRRTLPSSAPGNRMGTPALKAFRDKIAGRQAEKAKSRSLRDDGSVGGAPRNDEMAKSILDTERIDDAELFAAEIGRLEREHARDLIRSKHQK